MCRGDVHVRIYMNSSHDIVAAELLLVSSNLEGSIGHSQVGLHLGQGLVGDLIDTKLLLGLGQPQPQLAPGRCARAVGKQVQHLL